MSERALASLRTASFTALGPLIETIDLLDTSPSMLKQAELRAKGWGLPVHVYVGHISDLPPDRTYELIVACSVLHHVPDLQAFCAAIKQHQTPRGLFVHLQDPNSRFLRAGGSRSRLGQPIASVLNQLARFTPRRIWGRVSRELSGAQAEDYVGKTNRSLMQAGVVTKPLSVADLYAITDIHVNDGRGISLDELGRWLPDYSCLSRRSYAFFGKLSSQLPPKLRAREQMLSESNSLGGLHIGAVWALRD